MDDFFITAFSNANTQSYKNTLTNFHNDIPTTFNFPENENWHVCLQSVGFSTDFRNMLLPKDNSFPDIFIYSENMDESGINFDNKSNNVNDVYSHIDTKWNLEIEFSFPNYYISIKDIENFSNKVSDLGLKLKFEIQSGKYLKIKPSFIQGDGHKNYYIFFSENVFESLGLSLYYGGEIKETRKAIRLEKNVSPLSRYYLYNLIYGSEIIETINDNWNVTYPDIIKIKCDQVKEQIFNSYYSKDIAILKLKFDKNKKYHIHEFENEHYVPISNTTLNKISISFTDKYDRFLNLNRGVSTFARLKFKKMQFSDNFFNVRAYSDQKNPNNFTFEIPQQLYLDSKWKIALTSMHYNNKFKPLPYEESLRTIYLSSFNVRNKQLGELRKFILPNLKYKSVNELITTINFFLKKHSLSKVFLETEDNMSKCTLKLRKGTVLFIPLQIAEILGYELEENDMISTKDNIVTFFAPDPNFTIIKGIVEYEDIRLQGLANIETLKPLYFMVYCDIICPTIVGSGYANLLKILPVENQELLKIEEFKHKEFHPLESTLVKNININIRSNDGNLINFVDGSKVFLNLLFARK